LTHASDIGSSTEFMKRFRLSFLAFALTWSFSASAAELPDRVDFNFHIRGILSDRCYKCHGPDENTREANLRLDTFANATRQSKNGSAAIVPAAPDRSELIRRIFTSDADDLMPPHDAGVTPLSGREKQLLHKWIEKGAEYKEHWAFIPVQRPPLPVLNDPAWQLNGIDYFTRRQMQEAGIAPSPKAPRLIWLKRVSFDLNGLPPTPREIDGFLADDSANAHEKVVDRLLASPRFGEHMALPWLDAARYADTSGYQADWERFMWPWRNWVIDAFNKNLPFAQFTIEQIAGDMLPNPTPDQIIATGFNRNHRINDEGGVIAAEYAVEYVVDRIDTTCTTWLGLTMGCARCHDHKYDPLTMTDFYSLFAVFNNVPEKGKDGRLGYAEPAVDFSNPGIAEPLKIARAKLASIDRELGADTPAVQEEKIGWGQRILARPNVRSVTQWNILSPSKIEGPKGMTFHDEGDGSHRITGTNPDHSVITLHIELQPGTATAIRLEALKHPTHTHGSLARNVNGNFVLGEFECFLQSAGSDQPIRVDFARAEADHEQKGYPAAHAIDGKANTGWATESHVKRENRKAVFFPQSPLKYGNGDRLILTMKNETRFTKTAIGRFRISTTANPAPKLKNGSGVPDIVIAALRKTQRSPAEIKAIDKYFRDTSLHFHPIRARRNAAQKLVKSLEAKRTLKVMVMKEMETPRDTYLLKRGQYDQPDTEQKMSPNIPQMFGELSGEGDLPPNRLGFAKWLVRPDNPLTARVAVNRYWQRYFGKGLVKTTEDLGTQGSLPTHPELLDWLAAEFMDSGWNVKAMQKLIVMSATYRQSSKVDPGLLELDPENKLYARGPRFRLSAHELRDQALALSGMLSDKIGGPSVRPYQPPGLWSDVSFQSKSRSTDFYVPDTGDNLYRRSLYTFWKRSVAPPQMMTFDAAGREACVVRMTRTSTPLQALTLLNDTTFVEAARGLAQRMMLDGGATPEKRIVFGLKLAAAEPTPKTVAILSRGFDDYRAHFLAQPEAAKELLATGESRSDASLPPVELAAYTLVASTILNLDQTITKE
jgi:hypothetical protein